MNREEWKKTVMSAWNAAEDGHYKEAVKLYHAGDHGELGGIGLPAALNLLRHAPAAPEVIKMVHGLIVPVDPTEDDVFGTEAAPEIEESENTEDMQLSEISLNQLTKRLGEYKPFLGDHHLHNLEYAEPQPHLLVMSTGRCGTVSLYHLLKKTNYVPYHSFPFNSCYIDRLEQMCRYISGNYSDPSAERLWMKTRAAEWMGAALQGRPMASVTHESTIWAPVFAALHPKSKFIYLRRNPRDVFASMYGKNQFGPRQLVPVHFKFPWAYKNQELSLPDQIMWYLNFTEKFCRAFGRTLPRDRFLEVSADELFDGDIPYAFEELLLENSDLSPADIWRHFDTPINEKKHKAIKVEEAYEIYDSM